MINTATIRLIAYLACLLIAAVLVAVFTPTVDAISMAISWLILSAILCGSFELGWLVYRRTR